MIEIGKDCKIHESVQINVKEGKIDDRTVIAEGVKIEGKYVYIGKESFINRYAYIGGGSFFDEKAKLVTGDWFHLGPNSVIDIAQGVEIGHEVGLGIDSKVVTHGAYLDPYNLGSPLQWKGVKIGNNVWLPNAWINPGVVIGDQVIASARSYITKNIPNNALISGSPAKVIKKNYLPRLISKNQKKLIVNSIISQFFDRKEINNSNEYEIDFIENEEIILFKHNNQKTSFNIVKKEISGSCMNNSFIFKDQLRRNGIRFRFFQNLNKWEPWN
jgi:acetyltransferase-like isoleucine patch superfamily enzyme